jgi:hypothetical protein
MNNANETFDRDRTEESIVDMDGISGGSDAPESGGSPGSRFRVDSTTASGEPIEVGSPILSVHSGSMSSPAAPPPPYSTDRSSETPTRGQIITTSPTPPPTSSHLRPAHLPSNDELHPLRGDTYDDDEDDDDGTKPMSPRPPIVTKLSHPLVPTIELPDGKVVTK